MADSSINTGAKIAVAARALNMSEIDVAGMVEGLKRNAQLKKGITLSSEQAADAVLERLRKVYTLNQEMPANIDQLLTIPNSKVEWGEEGNQDDLQNFGGVNAKGEVKNQGLALEERDKVKEARDPNVFLRSKIVGKNDRGEKKYGIEEVFVPEGQALPDEFRDAALLRDYGLRISGRDDNNDEIVVPFREEVAPAGQILRQELGRLQQGVDIYGADAFPGAADVIGRIEDDLRPNRDAEASLTREMVQRDRLRQNSEVVEANNWRAQAAANLIGQDFRVGGRGAAADQAIANIGRIAKIGHAKIGNDFEVSDNPVDTGTAIPDSLPLNLPDQYNSPVTDNRFAGPLQRQEQWLVDHAPGYREEGSFNDYPQVAIGEKLSEARKAIEHINFGTQKAPRYLSLGEDTIRNLDDLQHAVDQAVTFGQQQGIKFYDHQDGKNVYIANPGINEVLQKGGMNDNQMNDVARALFAVEAARRNNVNQVAKNFYNVGMGQPASPVEFGGHHVDLGGGGAQIAKVGGAKVDGAMVSGQLQALGGNGREGKGRPEVRLNAQELATARKPFIGAVANEEVPRAFFLRGRGVKMTPEQRVSEFGPENAAIANRLERERDIILGMNRGPVDPANPPAGAIDPYAEMLRGQNVEIRGIARKNQAIGNQKELREAAKRMGQPIPANAGQTVIWDFLNGVSNQNPVQGPEGRLQVPGVVDVAKVRQDERDVVGQPVPARFSEQINDARTFAQRQDVDAFYNRKSDPVVAQGEMGSGGGNRPTAVAAVPTPDPWQKPVGTGNGVTQERERRMSKDMLNTLAELNSGPTQGPRTPGIRQKIMNSIKRAPTNFVAAPRYQRQGAAIGAGLLGVAGLSELIGGERNNREEEQYQ